MGQFLEIWTEYACLLTLLTRLHRHSVLVWNDSAGMVFINTIERLSGYRSPINADRFGIVNRERLFPHPMNKNILNGDALHRCIGPAEQAYPVPGGLR